MDEPVRQPVVTPPELLKRLQLPTTKGGAHAEAEYAELHLRQGDSVKLKAKYRRGRS